MKLAIVGSRSYTNYDLVETKMVEYLKEKDIEITELEIVSGGAKGVDKIAEYFAEKHSLPIKIFHADWDLYGKAAGMVRNKDIVNESEMVFIFWDGKSPGTKNTLGLCKKHKKNYKIFYV